MLFSEEKLKQRLEDSLTRFKSELKKITTGKPNPEVIGEFYVEAYGTSSKLSTVAQVLVEDAVTVKVSPWDKSIVNSVADSLKQQMSGVSMQIDSDFFRIKYLPLTEEDRKQKVKEVGKLSEEARIHVRQIRHDFMKDVEQQEGVSEDEVKRSKEKIQKLIDDATAQINTIEKEKETDLMTVK